MAELDISPKAHDDLVDIRLYSLEKFGPDVADAYFLSFDQAFDRLSARPLIGKYHPEPGPGMRCLVHHRHRIFYLIENEMVVIVRIIHHARDNLRALKS